MLFFDNYLENVTINVRYTEAFDEDISTIYIYSCLF